MYSYVLPSAFLCWFGLLRANKSSISKNTGGNIQTPHGKRTYVPVPWFNRVYYAYVAENVCFLFLFDIQINSIRFIFFFIFSLLLLLSFSSFYQISPAMYIHSSLAFSNKYDNLLNNLYTTKLGIFIKISECYKIS